jgi:hypothetical protein
VFRRLLDIDAVVFFDIEICPVLATLAVTVEPRLGPPSQVDVRLLLVFGRDISLLTDERSERWAQRSPTWSGTHPIVAISVGVNVAATSVGRMQTTETSPGTNM